MTVVVDEDKVGENSYRTVDSHSSTYCTWSQL